MSAVTSSYCSPYVQRLPQDMGQAAIILTFTSLSGPICGATISKALSIMWTLFGVTGCFTGLDSPIEYSRRAEYYCIA